MVLDGTIFYSFWYTSTAMLYLKNSQLRMEKVPYHPLEATKLPRNWQRTEAEIKYLP